MKFDTNHIDLSNVLNISRGSKERTAKYLVQFLDLVSERILLLNEAIEEGDRLKVRQILHKMVPQIQFFGINEIIQPIQRLEYDYERMPFDELKHLVKEIILKLDSALKEVTTIISTNFEDAAPSR